MPLDDGKVESSEAILGIVAVDQEKAVDRGQAAEEPLHLRHVTLVGSLPEFLTTRLALLRRSSRGNFYVLRRFARRICVTPSPLRRRRLGGGLAASPYTAISVA